MSALASPVRAEPQRLDSFARQERKPPTGPRRPVMPPAPDGLLDMLLTVRDVAEALSVGPRTVWRWAEVGKIPTPIRLGPKTTRWRASDVQAFLDAHAPEIGQREPSAPQPAPVIPQPVIPQPVTPAPPTPAIEPAAPPIERDLAGLCRHCEQRPRCDDAEGLGLCVECRQSPGIVRLYRPKARRVEGRHKAIA